MTQMEIYGPLLISYRHLELILNLLLEIKLQLLQKIGTRYFSLSLFETTVLLVMLVKVREEVLFSVTPTITRIYGLLSAILVLIIWERLQIGVLWQEH